MKQSAVFHHGPDCVENYTSELIFTMFFVIYASNLYYFFPLIPILTSFFSLQHQILIIIFNI